MDSKAMSIEEFFFSLLTNVKMYHWQTKSYAEHIATDQLYAALQPLVDTFVEVHSRDTSRPEGNFKVRVYSMSRDEFSLSLKQAVTCLRELESKKGITSSELLNIRDEMISNLNRTLYLFTFQ
jgi:hypothetical protein